MRAPVFLVIVALPLAAQTAKVDFEKQVRPLLAQQCFSCHGEDVQQSGLRLDKRQPAMRGGDYGPVIVPGKASESKLIKRVVNGDGGMRMPPTGALSNEDINLLRAWIDQGADFRMEIKEEAPPKPVDPKVTALISAVRAGAQRDVERMISADSAIVNGRDAGGSTPLHHAAAFGSLATMQMLLDHGAEVNAKNRRRSTPLHWAIRDEAKVRLLIARGADINAKQADGRSLVYQAASLGNGNSILSLLLEKGADANAATSNGQTSLMMASGRGNVEGMRLLLAKKADVNAPNGAGATALMGAAASGNAAAVALLLEKGADANAVTKKNESALANAATSGVDEMVKMLLDHGAKVNVQDERGYSPLMYAAGSEAMPAGVVKMLLAKGANANVTGEDETARSLAAKRGDTEVARLLGVSEAERKSGGVAATVNVAPERPIAESVSKALGLLAKQSHNFIRIAGCNSCHAQDLPSAAAAIARSRGIPAPLQIEQISEAMNGETPERLMDFGAPNPTSMGYEMFDRAANHAPADAYTDATVWYMKATQTPEGYWKNPLGRRPPFNSGDLQTTAVAAFTLRNFAPASEKAETNAVLARAAAWLAKAQAGTTEERAFRLMGLAWSGASSSDVSTAANNLAATQRADGGWSQLPGMASDAFASGLALYALNVAGRMPVADPVYQKGVQYLRTTQSADGSWHVMTRSIWIQPYFDSGFPYGHDQWISAAGTAWASMALSMTVEAPKVTRR